MTISSPDAPARAPRGLGDKAALVAVIVVLLAAMQIVSGYVPPYILPAPAVVLDALVRLIVTDPATLLVSLLRLFASLGFSLVVGTLLGLMMSILPRLRAILRALVVIDTGVPALSWILVAVFWFKNPEYRIFFVMVMILVPFYAMQVHDGIRAMPRDWAEMIGVFRPRRSQLLRFLILPHVAAYVIMTTKSIIGYATRMLVFAEMISATMGVGAEMGVAQASFHMEDVLAWTIALIGFNVLAQGGIGIIERHALAWRAEAAIGG